MATENNNTKVDYNNLFYLNDAMDSQFLTWEEHEQDTWQQDLAFQLPWPAFHLSVDSILGTLLCPLAFLSSDLWACSQLYQWHNRLGSGEWASSVQIPPWTSNCDLLNSATPLQEKQPTEPFMGLTKFSTMQTLCSKVNHDHKLIIHVLHFSVIQIICANLIFNLHQRATLQHP